MSPLELLVRQRKKSKCKKEIILAYFASVWWHDEKSLYVMFLKEGMPLVAEAWFHLVVSIQTLQRCPCDVHLTESTSRAEDDKQLLIKVDTKVLNHFPSLSFSYFYQLNNPSAYSEFFTAKKS